MIAILRSPAPIENLNSDVVMVETAENGQGGDSGGNPSVHPDACRRRTRVMAET